MSYHTLKHLSGGGSGIDAAGVRAAIGMSSANMDTQLSGISGKLPALVGGRVDASVGAMAANVLTAAAIAAGDDDLVDLGHIRLSRGLGRDLIGRLREGGERRDGRDDQRRRAENSVLHLDYPQRA